MILRRVSQWAFALLLLLLLISHASANGGLFTWLPLNLPTAVSGQGWQIGVLSLLPILVIGGWWLSNNPQISQITQMRSNQSAKSAEFSWGETAVTMPLAAFSLLVLVRLTEETAHVAAMLGLCWFVYLFLINNARWQQERLWLILAVVLLVQGAVAVAQFVAQRELGLAWLGEPILDLLVEGTSVAQRNGQNWLRAYGLNSHPNQLGLLLMALCLLIWPNRHVSHGWQRWLFWFGLAAGVAGLLVMLVPFGVAGAAVGRRDVHAESAHDY